MGWTPRRKRLQKDDAREELEEHALAKLIGAALLVGTIGVATKPDPASFAPFIKGWMKKRFALNRRVAAPGSSNIVNSVASTLSGWMDKATAAEAAAA